MIWHKWDSRILEVEKILENSVNRRKFGHLNWGYFNNVGKSDNLENNKKKKCQKKIKTDTLCNLWETGN